MSKTANPAMAGELNRLVVLDYLRINGSVSRTQLADRTRLSKTTVSRIVADLEAEGLVREVGVHSVGRGRPRVLFELVPDARYAIGAEITDRECRAVLVDSLAEPHEMRHIAISTRDPAEVADTLIGSIKDLTNDLDSSRIVGIGVGVPGLVDFTSGMITLSVMMDWHNVALGDMLKRQLNLPIRFVNRSHAAAYGEKWFGAGRDADDLLYVRVGSVIGGGLVFNGLPYLGNTFSGGQIGHMTILPNGAPCLCGNRGCLHTLATTSSLLTRARSLLREQSGSQAKAPLNGNIEVLSIDQLLAAANKHDRIAVQVFEEAGLYLGIAVANILNLLDLELVVIGGSLSRAGLTLLSPLREEVNKRALSVPASAARIEISSLGVQATVIGGATLMLRGLDKLSLTHVHPQLVG